jgi:hypothetical protein
MRELRLAMTSDLLGSELLGFARYLIQKIACSCEEAIAANLNAPKIQTKKEYRGK